MNERNEILVKQEMEKRANIKKDFLANADKFNNLKYSLEKVEGGYILTRETKDKWSFKVTKDGIEQLSEGPKSSSDYWAHAFMEAWMGFPSKHKGSCK